MPQLPTLNADPHARREEFLLLALACAAFWNIYITQPVLPRIETAFSVDTGRAAWTVSLVLLGFALANLPLGYLADRFGSHRLFAAGGAGVALCGFVAARTDSFDMLVSARFVQGLLLPALTTCAAAALSRMVPSARLNLVMGRYVAATVLGGLLGRLLGGLMPGADGWRLAFLIAGFAVFAAALSAARHAPRDLPMRVTADAPGYGELLRRRDLWLLWLLGGLGQAIFAPVFNTLPYRLAETPFALRPDQSTWLYLSYVIGIVAGPVAGRLSQRYSNGRVMITASLVLMLSLCSLLLPSLLAVSLALLGISAGFFGLHAAAVGALNLRLQGAQGRANALYVLSYYLGAAFGVLWSAWVYHTQGWNTLVTVAMGLTLLPVLIGLHERRRAGAPG